METLPFTISKDNCFFTSALISIKTILFIYKDHYTLLVLFIDREEVLNHCCNVQS